MVAVEVFLKYWDDVFFKSFFHGEPALYPHFLAISVTIVEDTCAVPQGPLGPDRAKRNNQLISRCGPEGLHDGQARQPSPQGLQNWRSSGSTSWHSCFSQGQQAMKISWDAWMSIQHIWRAWASHRVWDRGL